MFKRIILTNHKIEIRSKNDIVNIRTYYKDSNGMWNHMGDLIMDLDESIRFVRALRMTQEDMIK
jgi:hypothetical protein